MTQGGGGRGRGGSCRVKGSGAEGEGEGGEGGGRLALLDESREEREADWEKEAVSGSSDCSVLCVGWRGGQG